MARKRPLAGDGPIPIRGLDDSGHFVLMEVWREVDDAKVRIGDRVLTFRWLDFVDAVAGSTIPGVPGSYGASR